MELNWGSADDSARMKVIQRCIHCGDETNKGAKYCKECTTAQTRREIDVENAVLLKRNICVQCNSTEMCQKAIELATRSV